VCCDAQGVLAALGAMRIPGLALFDGRPRQLQLSSPGGLGVVLKSPDGGIWLQSRIRESSLGEAGNAELSELVFN
ncbi:MAG: hypothetical protein WAU27_14835, partial [Pseudomonadales bacterium]